MQTAYLILAAALAVLALWRKRDALSVVLCLSLAASVVMMFAASNVVVWVAAIDAFVCVTMLVLWTRHTSMRAWSVGLIGMVKTGFSLIQYVVDPYTISWAYAIAINAAYLAQVAVAGGFVDAMGHRLDGVFRRVLPRRHQLLRDGED